MRQSILLSALILFIGIVIGISIASMPLFQPDHDGSFGQAEAVATGGGNSISRPDIETSSTNDGGTQPNGHDGGTPGAPSMGFDGGDVATPKLDNEKSPSRASTSPGTNGAKGADDWASSTTDLTDADSHTVEWSEEARRAVYTETLETLLSFVEPEGAVIPNLATDVIDPRHIERVVEDDRGFLRYHVTVPLRKDLFWSDGSQFSAADVAFTYDLARRADENHPLWHYQNPASWDFVGEIVERVIVLDDATVRFVLFWKPTSQEWYSLMMSMPIFHHRQWREIEAEDGAVNGGVDTFDAYKPPGAVVRSVPQSLATINGNHPHNTRLHERIILFRNGAIAVSNPVTGYTYTRGMVGGEVDRSLTRQ